MVSYGAIKSQQGLADAPYPFPLRIDAGYLDDDAPVEVVLKLGIGKCKLCLQAPVHLCAPWMFSSLTAHRTGMLCWHGFISTIFWICDDCDVPICCILAWTLWAVKHGVQCVHVCTYWYTFISSCSIDPTPLTTQDRPAKEAQLHISNSTVLSCRPLDVQLKSNKLLAS